MQMKPVFLRISGDFLLLGNQLTPQLTRLYKPVGSWLKVKNLVSGVQGDNV